MVPITDFSRFESRVREIYFIANLEFQGKRAKLSITIRTVGLGVRKNKLIAVTLFFSPSRRA